MFLYENERRIHVLCSLLLELKCDAFKCNILTTFLSQLLILNISLCLFALVFNVTVNIFQSRLDGATASFVLTSTLGSRCVVLKDAAWLPQKTNALPFGHRARFILLFLLSSLPKHFYNFNSYVLLYVFYSRDNFEKKKK